MGIPRRQGQVCEKLLGHDDYDVPIGIGRLNSDNVAGLSFQRYPVASPGNVKQH